MKKEDGGGCRRSHGGGGGGRLHRHCRHRHRHRRRRLDGNGCSGGRRLMVFYRVDNIYCHSTLKPLGRERKRWEKRGLNENPVPGLALEGWGSISGHIFTVFFALRKSPKKTKK